MNDPIVDEIRRVRDEYAASFNYDMKAMVQDLREQQARSGRTFVDFSRERSASSEMPVPSPSVQPSAPVAPFASTDSAIK